MKSSCCAALLFAALLAGGCSTPSKVDKGPIRGTTFNFIDGGSKAAPGAIDSREQIHAAIQEAISRNLAKQGLTRVPSGGDLTVAYLVIVGDNVSTEAISTYFGYGRDLAALHEKAQDAYTSTKSPSTFEAGTLLIDIIDGKTFELLKRSYVVRPLLRDPSATVRAERIQEAVDAALAGVRVAH